MTYYKSWRIGKNGKARWRIVDDGGNVISENPDKEELKSLEEEYYVKRKYTNGELLNYLRKFFAKNGVVPTQLDFSDNSEYPSYVTYQTRFGGWNKAIEKAGLYVNCYTNLSDEELLNYLTDFFKEKGTVPVQRDFNGNPNYPSFGTYRSRFGSWSRALRLVELDIDAMVKHGIVKSNQQKGRLWEISVIEHFENRPKDLSGENCSSPCDGICPNGKIYEAKSAALVDNQYWSFGGGNKYKEYIEIYYLYLTSPTFPDYFAAFLVFVSSSASTVLNSVTMKRPNLGL